MWRLGHLAQTSTTGRLIVHPIETEEKDMAPEMRPKDLTAEEVAAMMDVCVKTVWKWCADGSLPGAYRLPNSIHWRIPPEAVEALKKNGRPHGRA
jgi:predicted DNA-binding transcriptional regulator AlpA